MRTMSDKQICWAVLLTLHGAIQAQGGLRSSSNPAVRCSKMAATRGYRDRAPAAICAINAKGTPIILDQSFTLYDLDVPGML